MPKNIKIAAKWDDVDADYKFTVLVDGKFLSENYSEEAAYASAFQYLGVQLEVEYD